MFRAGFCHLRKGEGGGGGEGDGSGDGGVMFVFSCVFLLGGKCMLAVLCCVCV